MGSRSQLPRGWSYPLKSSEAALLFPDFAATTWTGLPQHWQHAETIVVLYVRWSGDPRHENPRLYISAVPSDERAAVGEWIRSVVTPEVERWRLAAEGSVPWREANPMQWWRWSRRPRAGAGE